MDEQLQLLKDLLEIPSVNGRDHEGSVAEYLAEFFQEHGINAQIQRIDEKHANVIARITGKDQARTFVWNGHLDTVPYGDLSTWHSDPSRVCVQTEENEEVWIARGASDMKSGLAAMAAALVSLKKQPFCNILFIGTCDEEKNGIGAEAILQENLIPDKADRILIGEPTRMKLGTMQKGCLWLQIQVNGKTSHGAYPKEGINAVYYAAELAKMIQKYLEEFQSDLLGCSTGQITMIEGGTAPNMTPDLCRITMDIRMVPGLTKEMVIDHAGKCLKQLQREQADLAASFEVLNDRRAIAIDPQDEMVCKMRELLLDTGYTGEEIGINFFTDASILDREDRKNILLFGPGDPAMAHKPNEAIHINSYRDAITILTRLAEEGIIDQGTYVPGEE